MHGVHVFTPYDSTVHTSPRVTKELYFMLSDARQFGRTQHLYDTSRTLATTQPMRGTGQAPMVAWDRPVTHVRAPERAKPAAQR